MRIGLKQLIHPFFEVLIIVAVLFTINNYLGHSEQRIIADGMGYYEYLPSYFIHDDLHRNEVTFSVEDSTYQRILGHDNYVNYDEYLVNKYPVGTALLQLPFFLATKAFAEPSSGIEGGYETEYNTMVHVAALFYLFLGLIFLRKLLLAFEVRREIVVISQLLLVFGTPIIHYVNTEASYSHVYSFFTITAFFYFVRAFFQDRNYKSFLLAALFLGLIVILRQVNLIAILFLPFLAGSWKELKDGIAATFKLRLKLLIGVVLFFVPVFIQMYTWHLQTGSWIVYSYQGEGFDFLHPHFLDMLFSYKKGLFVYTPLLLLMTLSVVFLVKKQRFLMASWMFFFLFVTYVFSSWWSWFYGCSFGQRPYIDLYAAFVLPFAIGLSTLNQWRWLVIAISTVAIPINFIQAYQYKHYILHWLEMDKESYWKVFLKTEDKYQGLLWKKKYEKYQYIKLHTVNKGAVDFNQDGAVKDIEVSISEFGATARFNLLLVELENAMNAGTDAKVTVTIQDTETKEFTYWYQVPLIHFEQQGFNTDQKGQYFFEINEDQAPKDGKIIIRFELDEKAGKIENLSLTALRRKI
jgi:hypothetical protein